MAAAARTKEAVLTAAVDLAREAAVDLAELPEHVGEYLGATIDEDRLVSHRFACTAKGYRGWVWTVTLSRVPRGRVATVCEAVLLPGDDAILAPAWVPWDERLQPGDIGPGDVLPFKADDPRLEPGWTPTGDPELDEVAIDELALARQRVLSPVGLNEAADRWFRGRQGPATAGSVASDEPCMTCGFLIPLQGPLGAVFGVCANEWSPDDGKVVALEHGCGAHSQTDVPELASLWPEPAPLIDELRVEVTEKPVASTSDEAPVPASSAPESTAPESTAPETTEPESTALETTEPESTTSESTTPETTEPPAIDEAEPQR